MNAHGRAGTSGARAVAASFSAVFLLLLAVLLLPPAFALTPGRYSDYTYASDYHPPAPPAPVALNCKFFLPDDPLCAGIASLDNSSREPVLLAAIWRPGPEELQDWVRYWNSQLAIHAYYENISINGSGGDGPWGGNNSLRNMWFRLASLYPAVYDERDGYYYLSDQTLVSVPFHLDFVVANPPGGDWCAQSYDILGYDIELAKQVGNFSTRGSILPVSQLLPSGGRANLTITMSAAGEYSYAVSAWQNASCESGNCTRACVANQSNHSLDTLGLAWTYPIKRFPNTFAYDNTLSVPKVGFAQGAVRLRLPSDFLYYQFMVKGYTYAVSRRELAVRRYGEIYPLLRLSLIDAPSRSGTLHLTSGSENDTDGVYSAELRYKLPVEVPDIGETDCAFRLVTPFGARDVERACTTARAAARLNLEVLRIRAGEGTIQALVLDQLGNPLEGMQVQFRAGGTTLSATTNAQGLAQAQIPQSQSTMGVEASVVDSPGPAAL